VGAPGFFQFSIYNSLFSIFTRFSIYNSFSSISDTFLIDFCSNPLPDFNFELREPGFGPTGHEYSSIMNLRNFSIFINFFKIKLFRSFSDEISEISSFRMMILKISTVGGNRGRCRNSSHGNNRGHGRGCRGNRGGRGGRGIAATAAATAATAAAAAATAAKPRPFHNCN
jgi:hypothetical protein